MKTSSALSIGFGGVVGTLLMARDVKAVSARAPPTAMEHDDSVDDACANFTGFNFDEFFGLTNYSFAGYPSECTGPVIEYQDENERYPDFIYPSTEQDSGQDSLQPLSILFYAPWCTAISSRGMKQKYVDFAKDVSEALLDVALESGTNEEPVTPLFYTLSCDAHYDLCVDQRIKGFPTLKLFPPGPERIWKRSLSKDVGYDLHMSCYSVEEMEDRLERTCSDCSDKTLDKMWLRYDNAYENAVAMTLDRFRVEIPDVQEATSGSVDAIGVEDASDPADVQEAASGAVVAIGAEYAGDSEEADVEAALDALEDSFIDPAPWASEDNFIDPASFASDALFSMVVCSALMVAVVAIV